LVLALSRYNYGVWLLLVLDFDIMDYGTLLLVVLYSALQKESLQQGIVSNDSKNMKILSCASLKHD